MESKLNHQAIDAYSKALAKQLSQSFFSNSSHISGKEILELSPNKQINLMVLKNLFKKWKKENAKLQSPYFDYHSDEVKKAMKDFMNTLSRHIYVKKEHFEPLLKESIKDSVLLAFSPYDFYSKEINQRDDSRLRLSDLKDLKKYIKFNDFLLDGLIEHFESHKEKVVFNDTAFEMFNEVCSNSEEQPADIQPLLTEFSKTLPLSLADIYLEEDKDQTGILNEKLQSKDKQTLADKLAKSGGKSIMKMLTLNQRFMFVNELFEGNQNQFLSAIEQIDGMDNYKEASSHVKKSFADKYSWDMETEEVQEFMELVEKRFSQ
jgi:energy-converting hydrogenase A subunit M